MRARKVSRGCIMRRMRIRVKVEPGMFPSERAVSFNAGNQQYTLFVDQRDIRPDDTLEVYVVAENDKEAVIDLPKDTFTSGSRIRVPSSELLPA
jgi:hypothetical protein